MILATDAFTATRITGVAAYGIALVSCAVALFMARANREKARFALLLAVFEAFLLLDMAFNWRWALHQFIMDEAAKAALYASRRGPQSLALAVLVVLFAIGLRIARRRLRGRTGALFAAAGALLSLVLWCTEVVSLHQVDHILYRSIGGRMMVSFLWVFACFTTSAGVLVDSQSTGKRVRVPS